MKFATCHLYLTFITYSTLPRTRIPSPTKMVGDSNPFKKCSSSSIPSTPNKKISNEEKLAKKLSNEGTFIKKFSNEGTFTKKFSNDENSTKKISNDESSTESSTKKFSNESVKKMSCEESPSRSRIPVLRSSSYRVPKTISFGFGVPKVFPMHGKKSGNHDSAFYVGIFA